MNHEIQQHSRTALVLGGGGSAGNAWLIGVIVGLFDAGLDVTTADLIIGTSAGSTAAAQITGTSSRRLFSDILSAVPPQPTVPERSDRRRAPAGPLADNLEKIGKIIAASKDMADYRRRIGAAALETDATAIRSEQWRATVALRLPSQQWPQQRVLITAVDARTGDPVVFDLHSGVDLVDAVAASCAGGGFAYGIGGGRYIDGGYRSNADNADLAAGYERVLVLSPLGGRSLTPVEWGTHLATQVDELRDNGSNVEIIVPDGDSLEAFGPNMMDPSTRAPAAQAGYNQGASLAGQLNEFWR
jgi:NTE family protein